MKKSFLILATVATLTACSNDSVRENIAAEQVEIDFSTYTQKSVGTKAGTGGSLIDFHNKFVVNADKSINGEPELAFNNQLVTGSESDERISWTYSPKKVWDKSADFYTFYAAAPSEGWVFAEGKYSRANVELTGTSLDADTDIMLADDVTIQKVNYSSTPVNLTFKHILSRFNIAVKCTFDESEYAVLLNEVKVYNMVSSGSFAEGETIRWSLGNTKYSDGVGYANAEGLALNATANTIYQALVIPQKVTYVADVPMNGSTLGDESAPYLNIQYTVNKEKFDYSYNLAALFSNADISFSEGYQNTLTINIGLEEINFTADTDLWLDGENGTLDIN